MSKTVIEANKSNFNLKLKELWDYKELLLMLSYRDFKVRYAQTFLGIAWAFAQPFFTLIIFTLVFGKLVKINTYGVPYPLFAMSGMVAWNYFAFVMSQAGNSVINAQGLITKIFFPRLIIPLSKAIVGLIDLIITLSFCFFLFLYYQYSISSNIVFLPFCILLLLMSSASVGVLLSALTIRYRDVQHILPFLVQIGLYATPVAYPSNIISKDLQLLYYLNPMTGIVELFRWSFLGSPIMQPYLICISIGMCFLLLITGIFYFNRTESVIADII